MNSTRRSWLGRLGLLLILLGASGAAACAAGPVYVVKVIGEVWPGQARFVRESLEVARAKNASLIVLEINTFGGRVDAATQIKDAIQDQSIPTVAWVHNRAISAGALIALSAQKIAVAPGSTIGAAAPRTFGGEPVSDPKTLSYLRQEFAASAQQRGRNPDIAVAMVSAEKTVALVGVKPGGILTLRGDQALRVGYAEFQAKSVADIVKQMGLPAATPVTFSEPSLWETVSRVITSPWVTVGLLVFGCVMLFIELLTLHTWGLMGTLGIGAVGLVFASHITAGSAGWIGVVLVLAGLTFLLLEAHVFPGFGIAGVSGLLLFFLGMFWSLGGSQNAVFALSVSTILTIASIVGFFAYLPRSAVWKKMGQQMQQRASLGYVTSENLSHLLGRTGRAVTVLRPSGAADIDGIRVNVVTEGEFLEIGTPLVVIKVEGSRVVVDDVVQSAGDIAAA